MNWLFWVLLIAGLIVLGLPLLNLVQATFSTLFYVLGAILVIAAVVWAVSALSRTAAPPTTMP